MVAKAFDLVVIGTGSAVSTVASRCRAAGWSVAIIDSQPFGGTCALRGCDPKKVLVGAADVLDWVHRMKGKGIDPAGARIDWPELMRFKRSFTDPVPQQREASLQNLFAFAIRTGSRVGDLQDTMFAYPTHASYVSYML